MGRLQISPSPLPLQELAAQHVWVHQTFPNLRNFAWQQGYGAFSVGISQVRSITSSSSSNMYLAFLKKHGAHFDEKHLWD